MQGILLVDKPTDWTSFDVVNYVRKIVAQAEDTKPKYVKVGHTGTLDPFATGLLVLMVGKNYTRRATEFTKADKTYDVTMRLGQASTTGDPEGEITEVSAYRPTTEELTSAAQQVTGAIEQTPPAYSAVKINGQRAYKLARAGKVVVLEPRPIVIHSIEVASYDYPDVHFIVSASSGTYVRTLVEDMGKILGTGAYTTALRRLRLSQFNVTDAIDVATLTPTVLDKELTKSKNKYKI